MGLKYFTCSQGWKNPGFKKPNPHEFYCFFFVDFWGFIEFLIINSIFLALYQRLNAFAVSAHVGVFKNTQV